ncbi:MAG: hypothetical protein KGL39_09085 [Patescibacteria group bacterium]|nr:hypothetical protein [Patescibacteria group bacterium]
MPLYDYLCANCGVSERKVPYNECDKQVCWNCELPLQRLVSTPGKAIVQGGTGAGRLSK